jgi:hypothetical protein
MVTGCDNLLNDEYKKTLATDLPESTDTAFVPYSTSWFLTGFFSRFLRKIERAI